MGRAASNPSLNESMAKREDNPANDADQPGSVELGFATVDLNREQRTGFPEVIFGEGKSPDQIAAIAKRIHAKSGVVMVTRTDEAAATAVLAEIPGAQFLASCGAVWADDREKGPVSKGVVIVSAGTSDLPVVDEAALTVQLMGCEATIVQDVGVAGIHRLLAKRDVLEAARVVVVVAGMDGALPSVVAGLISAPVIAVPTSTGFGTGLEGFAAMLTMLNSCSAGVSVVNIDAGFSAGYQAALIARASEARA